MERNDQGWRDRDRWERERSGRRWERGEMGEGRTGPQGEDRYEARNDDRYDRYEGRFDERERREDRPDVRSSWEREMRGNYGPQRPEDRDRNASFRNEREDRGGWGRGWSERSYSRDDDRDRPFDSRGRNENEPWAHTAQQWGDRGTWRQDEGSYTPRPTRAYDDEPRWRQHGQDFRGEQYGYRVGQDRFGTGEQGRESPSPWGTTRRGKAPRDYRRADDRIRDEIIESIVRQTDIDASDVQVEVTAGEVTLTGTVEDRAAKRELEDVAERVFGVQDVHNNIKVRKSAWRELGDKLFGNGEQPQPPRPEAERRPSPKA
jgi:hypothetical protein